MNGTFVAAGPDPLLHLLRDRPAPDVLHDRRVGRTEPRVRVDQVLPVHAVRLGDDAAVVPGAVLPVEGAHLRHGRRSRSLHGAGIVHSTQVLLFAGLFLGFAIKVPMFPFHTWLPDAHTEAPTVGSVLLAAILLKLGDVRLHPHRAADPPGGRADLGALDRAARGDRHHLRRAGLSRATRYEAPDRVLLDRAHGLRDARHRDAHRLRHQRRDLRDGRARSHHRHALLHRGIDPGALQHPRAQPARRPAHPGAAPGMDPRVLRDGVARSPRPRRLLGRVPGDPVGVRPHDAERPVGWELAARSGRSAPTW